MTPLGLLSIAVAIIWLVPLALMARRHLHMLQLEEYDNRRFLRWARSEHTQDVRPWRRLATGLGAAVIVLSLSPLVGARHAVPLLALLLLALWLAPAALLIVALRPQPAKKPLVYTARVRRLIATTAVVAVLLIALSGGLTLLILHGRNGYAAALLTPVVPILVLLLIDAGLLAAGNVVARPV